LQYPNWLARQHEMNGTTNMQTRCNIKKEIIPTSKLTGYNTEKRAISTCNIPHPAPQGWIRWRCANRAVFVWAWWRCAWSTPTSYHVPYELWEGFWNLLVRFISAIICGDQSLEVEREASHLDPLRLWGWAAPGGRVELTACSEEGTEKSAAASSQFIFPVSLPSLHLLIITQLHPFSFWSGTFSLYNCAEQTDCCLLICTRLLAATE
jgi:hypothetical protein